MPPGRRRGKSLARQGSLAYPLRPLAVRVLKSHLSQTSEHLDMLVFHTRTGRPFRQTQIAYRYITPAARRAGLGRVTVHQLRLSFPLWADSPACSPVPTRSDRVYPRVRLQNSPPIKTLMASEMKNMGMLPNATGHTLPLINSSTVANPARPPAMAVPVQNAGRLTARTPPKKQCARRRSPLSRGSQRRRRDFLRP